MPIVGIAYLIACIALIALPLVIQPFLSADHQEFLKGMVAIGAAVQSDFKVLRLQDIVGSAATLVPFLTAIYAQSRALLLALLVVGIGGYAMYLYADYWLTKTDPQFVLQTVFDGAAASAATQLAGLIASGKLLFFWTFVSAGAVLLGFGNQLVNRMQRAP